MFRVSSVSTLTHHDTLTISMRVRVAGFKPGCNKKVMG